MDRDGGMGRVRGRETGGGEVKGSAERGSVSGSSSRHSLGVSVSH